MSHDFTLDGRKWTFLNADGFKHYAGSEAGKKAGLKAGPLKRQFATAGEILRRFQGGRGVLLADDVGLGKTTVGALVAWVVASQRDDQGNFRNRVRIYAPNEVLRRHWAEELERHVALLPEPFDANSGRIKQGDVKKLNAGSIQVTTHYRLVTLRQVKEKKRTKRTAHKRLGSVDCELMIIDEAHRAKGDSSAFNEALRAFGDRAKRKLTLTATPFSIRLTELEAGFNPEVQRG